MSVYSVYSVIIVHNLTPSSVTMKTRLAFVYRTMFGAEHRRSHYETRSSLAQG